jgi:hypothetical protein
MENVKRLRFLRPLGLALALVWAAGWTLVDVLSGFVAGKGIIGLFAHLIFPGLILLVSVGAAWKWGKIGGLILLIEGCLLFPIYFQLHMVVGALMLSVPPITSGLLLLVDASLAGIPPRR